MENVIKQFPNGYAILGEDLNYHPYSSVGDFDEYLGNALLIHNPEYHSEYFNCKSDFDISLKERIHNDEIYEEYRFIQKLIDKWNIVKKENKGTHNFYTDKEDAAFFNKAANELFKEYWVRIITEHLNFMNFEDGSVDEFFIDFDNRVSLNQLDLFKNKTKPVTLKDIKLKFKRLLIQIKHYDIYVLDAVMEYFSMLDYVSFDLNIYFSECGFAGTSVVDLINKTIGELFSKHPQIHYIEMIDQRYHNDTICLTTWDKMEGLLITSKDNNPKSYIDEYNAFAEGNFIDAILVWKVPKGKEHLYEDVYYSSALMSDVITIEEAMIFLGEQAAIDNYKDIADSKTPVETYNYTKLGGRTSTKYQLN